MDEYSSFPRLVKFTSSISSLRLAIAGNDRFREYAAEDSDFDAIRDEAGFKALIGQT